MNPLQDNFRRLAELIWDHGSTPKNIKGGYGLRPSWSFFGKAENDDPIIEAYNATHADIRWHVRGSSVKITLYSESEFGAEVHSDPVHEEVVDLEEVVGVINTFTSVAFSQAECFKALNKHYIGSPFAHKVDKDGNFVLVDHQNIELLGQAQKQFCPNVRLHIQAQLTKDGKWKNFKIIS